MTPRAIALTLLMTFAAFSEAANAQRNSGSRRAYWAARAPAIVAAPAPADSSSSAALSIALTPTATTAEPSGPSAQHLSGVDIVATGTSSFAIRLHSGMLSDGAPLYVIDGAPAVDLPNGIDWFKPTDIARVEVLKTPAELSRYGTRGAYGVVVITTRKSGTRS